MLGRKVRRKPGTSQGVENISHLKKSMEIACYKKHSQGFKFFFFCTKAYFRLSFPLHFLKCPAMDSVGVSEKHGGNLSLGQGWGRLGGGAPAMV